MIDFSEPVAELRERLAHAADYLRVAELRARRPQLETEMGRPDLWDEPDRFDPERFTPERTANRHRFAYFPFGGGSRTCIGNNFAMMEAQLVLAILAQRFQFQLVPEHTVVPDPTFVLKPRYGVMVRIG